MAGQTNEQAVVFNPAGEFEINLKRAGKSVVVRMPTIDEWQSRQKKIRTLKKDVNGGAEYQVDGVEDADLGLLGKIHISGDTTLDGAEAAKVIEKLSKAEADEATRTEDGYVIPVEVAGGIRTVHTLRCPSEADIRRYKRTAFAWVVGRHGRQEMRSNIHAISEFYDSLLVSTSGYAEGTGNKIPPFHKAEALRELLETLDELEGD